MTNPQSSRGRKWLLRAAIGLSAVALVAGCGGSGPEQARDRALAYFSTQVHEIDHSWSSIFDHLHRRFGLELTLASGRTPYGVQRELERPELFAVYRRLVDPAARVSKRQIAELSTTIDRMTASALHCDRIALPDGWVDVLRTASGLGAYALTHAVVATRWTLENGCLSEMELIPLHFEQVELLEALIEEREVLNSRHDVATDIWIEALAMLYYLGEGDRVRPEWIEALLAAQREDGGWPNHPRAPTSHPHPSALALWVLLEGLNSDAPATAWIPSG
ncbi:MAG: hypothetical protein GY723_05310 [bacterium]|nr:hypothetical protein [bacterium]